MKLYYYIRKPVLRSYHGFIDKRIMIISTIVLAALLLNYFVFFVDNPFTGNQDSGKAEAASSNVITKINIDTNLHEDKQAVKAAGGFGAFNARIIGLFKKHGETDSVPLTDSQKKIVGTEVYRWYVHLNGDTVYSFGLQTKDGIKPVVRIMDKDGWFVKYYPTSSNPHPTSPCKQGEECQALITPSSTLGGGKVGDLTALPSVEPKVNGRVIEWPIADGITARYTAMPDRIKADYIVSDKSKLSSSCHSRAGGNPSPSVIASEARQSPTTKSEIASSTRNDTNGAEEVCGISFIVQYNENKMGEAAVIASAQNGGSVTGTNGTLDPQIMPQGEISFMAQTLPGSSTDSSKEFFTIPAPVVYEDGTKPEDMVNTKETPQEPTGEQASSDQRLPAGEVGLASSNPHPTSPSSKGRSKTEASVPPSSTLGGGQVGDGSLASKSKADAGLGQHDNIANQSSIISHQSLPSLPSLPSGAFKGSYTFTKQGQGSGLLAIQLPKDKLDQAKFPITIDPVVIDNTNIVATSTAYANGRKLVRDQYGNLIAVFDGSAGTANNDDIWYKNASGTSWSDAATDLTSTGAGNTNQANEPSADLDSSGNLWVAFRDSTGSTIRVDKFTVTRSGNDISTIALATGYPFTLDSGASAISKRPSMIIANKGMGAGKEKVVVAWAMNGTTRGEIRTMQCNVDAENGCANTGTVKLLDGNTGCVLTSCRTSAATGGYTSIACPTATDCKIAYYDFTIGDLRFADCDDAACGTGTVKLLDGNTGCVLTNCSTTADVGNNTGISMACPTATDCKIAYLDNTTFDLKFADCDDAQCGTGTVKLLDGNTGCVLTSCDTTTSVGQYPSIACPTATDCKIAYYALANGDLKFADCDDAQCGTGTVKLLDGNTGCLLTSCNTNVVTGGYTSIACPTASDCKISYAEGGNGTHYLKFADCDDAQCGTGSVNILDGKNGCVLTGCSSNTDSGLFTSIACPTATDCKISYEDGVNGDLKFADCDDAQCSTGTVKLLDGRTGCVLTGCDTGTTDVAGSTSIACPTATDCKISYTDNTNADLKFADCNGSDCGSAASSWTNMSQEKYGGGSSTDTDTVGPHGLSTSTVLKGTADKVFNTATTTTHHAVITQMPGRPKRSPTKVFKSVGASPVYTDLTGAYDNDPATTSDVSSLITANPDYIYVGDDNKFSKVAFDMANGNTLGDAAGYTMQYWNGASWTSTSYVSASDNTVTCSTCSGISGNIAPLARDGSMRFDEPADWATTSVNSVSKYWIRLLPYTSSNTTIAEIYITDRNARALVLIGGDSGTTGLSEAIISWDEVLGTTWESSGRTAATVRPRAGVPWEDVLTGKVDSTAGSLWTQATNFPLSATIDVINNKLYVAYYECVGASCATTSVLMVKSLPATKDPVTSGNWTDTSFPAETEAVGINFSLASDGGDIYLFEAPNPGTNTLLYWKYFTDLGVWSGAGTNVVNFNASTQKPTHPQAIVSKALGDTIAIDLIWTNNLTTPEVDYERHYVNSLNGSSKIITGVSSADDAFMRDCVSGTDDQDIAATTLKLGKVISDASCVASANSNNHVAMNFFNAAISPKIAISSAYLDFRVSSRTGAGTALKFKVYGFDTDSGATYTAFTDSADPASNNIRDLTRTTSFTDYDTSGIDFTTNEYRIDVTNVVQEIVCRQSSPNTQPCVGNFNKSGTWASGNDLSLLLIYTGTDSSSNNVLIDSLDSSSGWKPTLQINCGESCSAQPSVWKNYSIGEVTTIPTNTNDLDQPLSTTQYTSTATDDTSYLNIAATNNHYPGSAYPMFIGKVNNTNNGNSNPFSLAGVVRSTIPASTKNIYLQVYRAGGTNAWVTEQTVSSGAADTDLALSSGTISASASEYYQAESGPGTTCSSSSTNCWIYWRIYQDSPTTNVNEVLSIDQLSTTFTPIATKIVFTNAARTATEMICSPAFTIQTQDASNNPLAPTQTTVVRITSDATSYVVYSDSSCTSALSNGDVTFTTSDSEKTFYIIDSQSPGASPATRTLTATRQSGDTLTGDTDDYTLRPSQVQVKGNITINGGTTIGR